MQKLLTDNAVRRTAQFIIAFSCLSLIILQSGFIATAFLFLLGFTDSQSPWGLISHCIVLILMFPFQQEFASFLTVGGALVPLTISSVCFTVNTETTPPSCTTVLNRFGQVFFIILTLGVLLGVSSIVTFDASFKQLRYIVNGDDSAIRGVLASILVFQTTYVIHLLGINK